MFDQASKALPQVRAGRIKAYAFTAKSHLAEAPDIPTVDEAGLPEFYVSVWHAGDRDPDGTTRLPRRGIFTWLIAGRANDWRIVAAHNTNLREGIAHRLANAA
jgi:hypothetical protein